MPYRSPPEPRPARSRPRWQRIAGAGAVVGAVVGAIAAAVQVLSAQVAVGTLRETRRTHAARSHLGRPPPDMVHSWIVRERPGSTQEVIFGPDRMTVTTTGDIVVANERMQGNIVAAVPVEGRWVFVDDHGSVASALHFLDDVVPLGTFSCGFLSMATKN